MMRDNKPAEQQALNLIRSRLIKYGFIVCDPSSDEDGADLLIVKSITEQFTQTFKVQSKYRKLSARGYASITIPVSYVTENFVVFLYLENDSKEETLFAFFENVIKTWSVRGTDYVLNINNGNISSLANYIFNETVAEHIRQTLNKLPIRKYTTILIDGIFLEKALFQTERIYREIWPKKKLVKPTLKNIIENLLNSYNRFPKNDSRIKCTLYTSAHFNLEMVVGFPPPGEVEDLVEGVRLNIQRTKDILAFEVTEDLERVINSENVLLVAKDRMYVPPLKQLLAKGADVLMITSKFDKEEAIQGGFRWGDISYPLGMSIGLKRGEL